MLKKNHFIIELNLNFLIKNRYVRRVQYKNKEVGNILLI